jgi:succinate dehydrogenase / fumarate reductase, membrane anchor subunit
MTWFIVSLVRLPDLEYQTVVAWLQQPIAAIPLLLLIASVFYHFRLGVQVMLEDYIHHEGNKVLAMMLLNFYVVALAFTAVFSVLKAFTAVFSVLKIAFGAV